MSDAPPPPTGGGDVGDLTEESKLSVTPPAEPPAPSDTAEDGDTHTADTQSVGEAPATPPSPTAQPPPVTEGETKSETDVKPSESEEASTAEVVGHTHTDSKQTDSKDTENPDSVDHPTPTNPTEATSDTSVSPTSDSKQDGPLPSQSPVVPPSSSPPQPVEGAGVGLDTDTDNADTSPPPSEGSSTRDVPPQGPPALTGLSALQDMGALSQLTALADSSRRGSGTRHRGSPLANATSSPLARSSPLSSHPTASPPDHPDAPTPTHSLVSPLIRERDRTANTRGSIPFLSQQRGSSVSRSSMGGSGLAVAALADAEASEQAQQKAQADAQKAQARRVQSRMAMEQLEEQRKAEEERRERERQEKEKADREARKYDPGVVVDVGTLSPEQQNDALLDLIVSLNDHDGVTVDGLDEMVAQWPKGVPMPQTLENLYGQHRGRRSDWEEDDDGRPVRRRSSRGGGGGGGGGGAAPMVDSSGAVYQLIRIDSQATDNTEDNEEDSVPDTATPLPTSPTHLAGDGNADGNDDDDDGPSRAETRQLHGRRSKRRTTTGSSAVSPSSLRSRTRPPNHPNHPKNVQVVQNQFAAALADLTTDLPTDERIVGSAPPVPTATAKSPLRRLQLSPFQRVPPYLQVLPRASHVNTKPPVSTVEGVEETKTAAVDEDDVNASELVSAWRVNPTTESELAAAIVGHDGVEKLQNEAIRELDQVIAWLRDKGETALARAEEGADPLIQMRTEVDELIQAFGAVEAEVQQLERERKRIEGETLQVLELKEELDRFKDLTAARVDELGESLGQSLGQSVSKRPTKLPYSQAKMNDVLHRRQSTTQALSDKAHSVSVTSVILKRRRDYAAAVFDEVRVLESMREQVKDWRNLTDEEMASLRDELDAGLTVRADLMSERLELEQQVKDAEDMVDSAQTTFHQLEAQAHLDKVSFRVTSHLTEVSKAEEAEYSRDTGIRAERRAVADRVNAKNAAVLGDCQEVNELVHLVDDAFGQEELLRGRQLVGGFGMPVTANTNVGKSIVSQLKDEGAAATSSPTGAAMFPAAAAAAGAAANAPGETKADDDDTGGSGPTRAVPSPEKARLASILKAAKDTGDSDSRAPPKPTSPTLSLDMIVKAQRVASRKRWGGLFSRKGPKVADAGVPGYKSMFSAEPGHGPLDKVIAARFKRVARAVGDATQEGIAAGDTGGWVWKASRGWLGERARNALNRRLFRITVDTRRALEKEFAKEATAERFRIGQRAIANLERRTNQLFHVWSAARVARRERVALWTLSERVGSAAAAVIDAAKTRQLLEAARLSRRLTAEMTAHEADMVAAKSEMKEAAFQHSLTVRKAQADKQAAKREVDALHESTQNSIAFFKRRLAIAEAETSDLKLRVVEEREAGKVAMEKQVSGMRDLLNTAEEDTRQMKMWGHAMQLEVADLKAKHGETDAKNDAIIKEKTKEAERLNTQLRAEIEVKDKHVNWVAALKGEVALLQAEFSKFKADADARHEADSGEIARLKYCVWKRDEAGRRLRTDVDKAVLFFTESMAGIAGSSYYVNDRMAANGVLEALAGLIQGVQPESVAHATRALGRSGWNGPGERAVVSTLARHSWVAFVDRCATEECTRRRKQTRAAEWALLEDGHEVGEGRIGMGFEWVLQPELEAKARRKHDTAFGVHGEGEYLATGRPVASEYTAGLEQQKEAAGGGGGGGGAGGGGGQPVVVASRVAPVVYLEEDPEEKRRAAKRRAEAALLGEVEDDEPPVKPDPPKKAAPPAPVDMAPPMPPAAATRVVFKETKNQGFVAWEETKGPQNPNPVLVEAGLGVQPVPQSDTPVGGWAYADADGSMLETAQKAAGMPVVARESDAYSLPSGVSGTEVRGSVNAVPHRGGPGLHSPSAHNEPPSDTLSPAKRAHVTAFPVYRPKQPHQGARAEIPHMQNQTAIGCEPGTLRRIVELLEHGSEHVLRSSTDAVAILALSDANRTALAQLTQCIPRLVSLCSHPHPDITRNASAALGNLAFQNPDNQQKIGELYGIDALVQLCREALKREGVDVPDNDTGPASSSGLDAHLGANGGGAVTAPGAARDDVLQTSTEHSGVDVDVLENCTAALSTLAASCDDNARRVSEAGGLEVLVALTTSRVCAENELVHANAAEALANITRHDCWETSQRVLRLNLAHVVLLLGSRNLSVQRAAPLVLGNIAQDDRNRQRVGVVGGIEGLFLTISRADDVRVRINCLWALSNLAWNAGNQERIGRFYDETLDLCEFPDTELQATALSVIANSLFYHDTNRRRLNEMPRAVWRLLMLCRSDNDDVAQHAVRALGSVAAYDEAALLVNNLKGIPTVLTLCKAVNDNVCRYAMFCIGNLALNEDNKAVICALQGVETIVARQTNTSNPKVRETATEVLKVFGANVSEDSLKGRHKTIKLNDWVGMVNSTKKDYSSMSMLALEHIVAQVASGGAKMQRQLVELGLVNEIRQVIEFGIKLVNRLTAPSPERLGISLAAGLAALRDQGKEEDEDEPFDVRDAKARREVMVKAMWALRPLLQGSPDAHAAMHEQGCLEALVKASALAEDLEVQEAALAALAVTVSGDARTSRVLLERKDLLHEIIQIAEMGLELEGKPSSHKAGGAGAADVNRRRKANADLAQDVLFMVGPHSWVECTNCGSREAVGRFCSKCGHRIGFLAAKVKREREVAALEAQKEATQRLLAETKKKQQREKKMAGGGGGGGGGAGAGAGAGLPA